MTSSGLTGTFYLLFSDTRKCTWNAVHRVLRFYTTPTSLEKQGGLLKEKVQYGSRDQGPQEFQFGSRAGRKWERLTIHEDGRALDGDSGSSSCKRKRKEGHLGLREFWKVTVGMNGHILRLVSRPVVCSRGPTRYAGKLEASRGVLEMQEPKTCFYLFILEEF